MSSTVTTLPQSSWCVLKCHGIRSKGFKIARSTVSPNCWSLDSTVTEFRVQSHSLPGFRERSGNKIISFNCITSIYYFLQTFTKIRKSRDLLCRTVSEPIQCLPVYSSQRNSTSLATRNDFIVKSSPILNSICCSRQWWNLSPAVKQRLRKRPRRNERCSGRERNIHATARKLSTCVTISGCFNLNIELKGHASPPWHIVFRLRFTIFPYKKASGFQLDSIFLVRNFRILVKFIRPPPDVSQVSHIVPADVWRFSSKAPPRFPVGLMPSSEDTTTVISRFRWLVATWLELAISHLRPFPKLKFFWSNLIKSVSLSGKRSSRNCVHLFLFIERNT